MTEHLKWTVGDVTITRLQELELPVPYDPAAPFLPDATPEALAQIPGLAPYLTPDGGLILSFHALLVEAPGLCLVVDTCFGNDREHAYLGGALHTDFLERMYALGWPPERVDAVVCTHMHFDHVGWNTQLVDGRFVPTFPRARYLVCAEEYAHFTATMSGDDLMLHANALQPVAEAGLLSLVAPDHRLSPEVCLVPTPGHTIGHVSVAIESQGQRALISGDFLHHPCQLPRPHWNTSFEHDPAQSLATRKAMLASLADTEGLLIGTHFPAPTAGHVVREGAAYRFTQKL